MRENVTLLSTSWLFVIGISLLCAVPGATRVEAQAVRAAILGTVRDGTGAALPGVTIDARNTGTGVSQSVTTNGQGRFNLPDLPLGTYDVQASLAGFQSVVHKGLTLTVGSQNVVDFALPLGQVAETVLVTGESPIVDTTSAAFATTISQKQIADLPLNGRNYAQLITLSPGVTTVQFQGSLFGRQQAVIRTETRDQNRTGFCTEQLLPRPRVPKPQRPVPASARQPIAGVVECDGDTCVSVPLENVP